MTIRELRNVISGDKTVFIKPTGRFCYYDGTMDSIPNILLDVEVIEIVPQIYPETDGTANRKYYWGLGIWINNVLQIDEYIKQHGLNSSELSYASNATWDAIEHDREYDVLDIAEQLLRNRDARDDLRLIDDEPLL